MENDSFLDMFSPVSFCGHVLVVRCGLKGCSEKMSKVIEVNDSHQSNLYCIYHNCYTNNLKKKTYRSQPLVYLFEMVFDLISVSSSHLNVTFLLFKVSDDEDDTHPNIDTPSLFRWRHQARVERMEEAKKERDAVETKISE